MISQSWKKTFYEECRQICTGIVWNTVADLSVFLNLNALLFMAEGVFCCIKNVKTVENIVKKWKNSDNKDTIST